MKKINLYFGLMAIAALISASGNLPYGYRFAALLFARAQPYTMLLGSVLAAAAMFANGAVGTYSLVNMYKNRSAGFVLSPLTISFIGAIPMGFICFFGYRNIILLPINLVISSVVIIVNGAIGYVAITSLLAKTKEIRKWLKNIKTLLKKIPEVTTKAIGFSLGLCMSLVGYIAAASGTQLLFKNYGWTSSLITKLVYVIAILTWIPFAALFANAMQEVSGEAYQQAIKINKALHSPNRKVPFSWLQAGLIIFCLLSGAAFTQVAIELFSPDNNIPMLFKKDDVQIFVYYFIVPVTYIANSAVNYLALKKLIEHFKKSKNKK